MGEVPKTLVFGQQGQKQGEIPTKSREIPLIAELNTAFRRNLGFNFAGNQSSFLSKASELVNALNFRRISDLLIDTGTVQTTLLP